MNHPLLFSSIPTLEGPHLFTKAIDHSDDEAFVSILMNPNCFRHTPGSARKTTEAAKHVIDHYARDFSKESTVIFGLYQKSTRMLIGILEVFNIRKKEDTVEIGYRLGEAHWNKGFATEGVKLLTRYLFDIVQAKTIKATAMRQNEASNRLLEKCGFRIIRTSIQETVWKDKGLVDLNHYESTR